MPGVYPIANMHNSTFSENINKNSSLGRKAKNPSRNGATSRSLLLIFDRVAFVSLSYLLLRAILIVPLLFFKLWATVCRKDLPKTGNRVQASLRKELSWSLR